MKKRLKVLFSILILVFVITGCDRTPKPEPSEPKPSDTTVDPGKSPVIHGATDKTIFRGETFVPLEGITATD